MPQVVGHNGLMLFITHIARSLFLYDVTDM